MSDETFVSELFDGDYWLTPDELAAWLKLRKDWVYDTVQADKIPFHKFGRQLRFRHSEIQVWLDDRRPAPSVITISVDVPGHGVVISTMDLRDLLDELTAPPPEPEEPATEDPEETTVVVQAEVDEAGMEVPHD